MNAKEAPERLCRFFHIEDFIQYSSLSLGIYMTLVKPYYYWMEHAHLERMEMYSDMTIWIALGTALIVKYFPEDLE